MYQVSAFGKSALLLELILSSLAILGLQTQCLYAQFPLSPQSNDSSLIEPPREVSRLLVEAKKEIANSNWGVATKALGLALGLESDSQKMEGGGQDYFLITEEKDYKNTVHQAALDLFNSIPPVGQETVEIRYGIQAQQEITEAAKVNDWHKIDYLAGKYIMTKSGRQAAYLAAEHQIALGQPAWAAMRWEALLESNAARKQFGPVVALAAASAWKAADQPQRAKLVIARIPKLFGTQHATLNGIDFNFEDANTSFDKLDIDRLMHRSEKLAAPTVQGGSSDRNADSFAGLPLPFVSWQSLLHESSRHEQNAQEIINSYSERSSNVSFIPSRSAVVVAPHLIVMTYDQRIHGINLQTGSLEWVSAFAGTPKYMRQYVNDFDMARQFPQDDLVFRIWGQKAIGQLAADSKFIYTVVDQPSIDTAENLQRGVNATIAAQQPQRDFNVLQAYSIPQQASLAWEVGGDSGLAEPALANVLFLGPPLPVNEELFVIGEANGEVLLFSLNPEDGHLLWKQQLAANNSISIAKDSIRRSFGCSPTFYGGVLFCPTLSNQLIAIDLVSRSLLWSQQYTSSAEISANSRVNVWGGAANTGFNPLLFRSAESSVVVGNGVAVYAPPDSAEIMAINIYDGKRLWKLPDRGTQYVGCIVDNCAVISTGHSVVGLELQTGKQRWTTELKEHGMIVGRMARNGDNIIVPLSKGRAIALNATNGKQVGTMQVEELLGNLIATKDSLISISPISVTCYPIRDQVKKRIQQDLADQKDSPNAVARLAEIAYSESDWETAYKLGLEAFHKAPSDPEIRSTLRKIAIKAVETDFEKFFPAVMEIRDLMESGPKRDVFARSLIQGLILRKQYDEALDRLVSLALSKSNDLHANDLGQANDLHPNDHLELLEETWITANFDRLFQYASPAAKDRAFQRLMNRITASVNSGTSITLLERYTRYIPQASSYFLYRAIGKYAVKDFLRSEYFACQAYELAGKLQDVTVAEQIRHQSDLLRLLIYRDVGRAYAVVQMANKLGVSVDDVQQLKPEILASTNLFAGLPAIHFEEIERVNLPIPGQSEQSPESNLDLTKYLDTSGSWRSNEVVVDDQLRIGSGSVVGELICKHRAAYGDALDGWDVKLTASSLEVCDPTYLSSINVRVDQVNFSTSKANCLYVNSLVLLQRASEIVAIDTLSAQLPADASGFEARELRDSPSIIWNESFGSSNAQTNQTITVKTPSRETYEFGAEKASSEEKVSVLAAGPYGLIVATTSSITCIDYLNCKKNWSLSLKAFDAAHGIGRDNSSSIPWISYKEGKLYAIDPIARRRLIVDVRDGEVLDAADISVPGHIWGVYEDTFLTFKTTDSNRTNFKLCNSETADVIFSVDASATNDKAELAEDAFFCWGESGLIFWNLKDRTEHKYSEATPGTSSGVKVKIGNARVQRFQDTLLLIGYFSNNRREYLARGTSSEYQESYGRILAIDAKTGQPKWKEPIDSFYAFPIHQPRMTPAFILARHLQHSVDRTIMNTASLALVDLQSGGLIYQNDYLPSANGSDFKAIFSPKEHSLDISYRSAGLSAQWTEKPHAPREQTASIGDTSKKQLLEKMPKKIRNQIKESQEEAPEQQDPFE